MKRTYLVFSALAALVLLATACGPQATQTAAPLPTAAATQPPAAVPVTGAATVSLGKTDALGTFLTDAKGMTLYLFTKDTPNTSNCYGKCATAWPPLLTSGKPVAGDGVDASKLGTTKRTDGVTQVTYNGWPLYYYFKDKAAGDVTGQLVGNVWFVVSPSGDKIESTQAIQAPAATQAATQAPAAAASGPAMVNLTKTDKLGSFLVDGKGMTLYLFTKDSPNTSVCYDKCAVAWPPLLTSGTPVAGNGVDASKFGTTTRKDGTTQVTYNGWPLYYYFKDKAPGDVTGQNVGTVWFVVSPTGDKITTAP